MQCRIESAASTVELLEALDRRLAVLPHFDEIAVGIAHVAAQLPAVIVEWLRQELSAFGLPLPVAGPDVGDAQIQEAADAIAVGRRRKKNFGLVGSWTAAGIQNDPGVRQLDVTGILQLNDLAAENADVEFFRLRLVVHGQEMSDVEAGLSDGRVRQIHAIERHLVELWLLRYQTQSWTAAKSLLQGNTKT